MPDDTLPKDNADGSAGMHNDSNSLPKRPANGFNALFAIPAPVKQLFDKFPLVTYAANELPLRAPQEREEHVLHVFTDDDGARHGRPSYNPACLKWQTYLRFRNIAFRTVASNNHASPSGALPFLSPGTSAAESAKLPDPVSANKLRRWLSAQPDVEKVEESEDVRYEAYTSLLDHRIRKAWLYQLYLEPANTSLLRRLYVALCSSNFLVRTAITSQLRQAAETEILKTLPAASAANAICEEDIYAGASEALKALSHLLGADEWFFGGEKPSLFDAQVFAYTELCLDGALGWSVNELGGMVKMYDNLVQHRERIRKMCF